MIRPDAKILLSLLRSHRERLRVDVPEDEQTRRVALLSELRRKLVDHRTQLGNQLTSTLKQYFPQALELFGQKVHTTLALDLLQRWPELRRLQQARAETVRRFYHQHQVRRPELIDVRLARIAAARALTTDRVLCESLAAYALAVVAQLRSLNTQIEQAEAALEEAFAAHPDAAAFASFPGAGAAMAPRLCVLFGTDRARWASAAEMQKYYGIAPVIEKSGQSRWVHWRWNAPVFARQTLVEWAGVSVRYCDWARAYYAHQKERQKPHHVIMRGLAFKWLRVLWRCWRDRALYDDQRYLALLKTHNPAYLANLTSEPDKKPEKTVARLNSDVG
jgi:transposase